VSVPRLIKRRQVVNAKADPRIADSSSNKRYQLFIRTHNETLSVTAMRVHNPDRSPLEINR
jgi:hypothetical protein